MKKNLAYLFSLLFFQCFISCQPGKEDVITEKNKCYAEKLKMLRNEPVYITAMSQFKDTFKVLKTQREYFGVPEIVDSRIDNAIFFKKDKTECILIVLKKNGPPYLMFGTARIVRGQYKNGKWEFGISLEYGFELDYFELLKENSFDNISKLARYSVLTDGDVRLKGCEIDDYLWFTEMKE